MPHPFEDPYGPSASTGAFDLLKARYGGSSMPSAGSGGASERSASMSDEPRVYMGSRDILAPIPGNYYSNPLAFINAVPDEHTVTVDRLPTIARATTTFDRMTAAEQHDIARLLMIAGYLGVVDLRDVDEEIKSVGLIETRNAYIALLNDTSSYNHSGLKVTPTDVLRSAVAFRLRAEGVKWDGDMSAFDKGLGDFAEEQADEGVQDLSGTLTRTTRSVNIMDPMDAKYMTRAMLQQELGRDPTQAEYEDFISALHAAERANPTTTKQTVTYNEDGEIIKDNSVTHQGITDAGLTQKLYQKAQAHPDWAEWQAMGTYAPALFAALGATVPGA